MDLWFDGFFVVVIVFAFRTNFDKDKVSFSLLNTEIYNNNKNIYTMKVVDKIFVEQILYDNQETGTRMVRACHALRHLLEKNLSGHHGGWATSRSAEERLDGRRQRAVVLSMPEVLTTASHGKDSTRITVESSLVSSGQPNLLRELTELQGVLTVFISHPQTCRNQPYTCCHDRNRPQRGSE